MKGEGTLFAGVLAVRVEVGRQQQAQGASVGGSPVADKSGKGAAGKGLTGSVQASGNNNGANVGGEVGYDFGGESVGVGVGGGGPTLGIGLGGSGGRKQQPRGEDDGKPSPSAGVASMGAPSTIYLRFENRGSKAIEFRVIDFDSPMGNFVVQPERIALEPGQWAEVEPMISQIAPGSGSVQARVTVVMDGKREEIAIAVEPPPIHPASHKSN